MENEKLHFFHISLHLFKKGMSVRRATKHIQDVYLDRAPDLRTVQLKSGFVDFEMVISILNGTIRSGRPSGIVNDSIRDLVNNIPRITTGEIAEGLNVENSTAFRHLKELGYTLKLDASEIELFQSP